MHLINGSLKASFRNVRNHLSSLGIINSSTTRHHSRALHTSGWAYESRDDRAAEEQLMLQTEEATDEELQLLSLSRLWIHPAEPSRNRKQGEMFDRGSGANGWLRILTAVLQGILLRTSLTPRTLCERGLFEPIKWEHLLLTSRMRLQPYGN